MRAPSPRDLVASLRTVQVPGTPATYANRAYFRDLGPRWDPANHRWHGTTTAVRVKELRDRLGLVVKCFGSLEAPPKGPAAPRPASEGPAPCPTSIAVPPRDSGRRLHDGSRMRVEARVVFPPLEEEDEIVTPGRQFTLLEITSGLPDDCREEDEREEGGRARDLRGRVKAARATLLMTPGLEEALQVDWRKAARFYPKQGITEGQFRAGVPDPARLCGRRGASS